MLFLNCGQKVNWPWMTLDMFWMVQAHLKNSAPKNAVRVEHTVIWLIKCLISSAMFNDYNRLSTRDYLHVSTTQENFELNHETLYLAVKLADHYLSVTEVRRASLQLIGSTAMLIAAKFEVRQYLRSFIVQIFIIQWFTTKKTTQFIMKSHDRFGKLMNNRFGNCLGMLMNDKFGNAESPCSWSTC